MDGYTYTEKTDNKYREPKTYIQSERSKLTLYTTYLTDTRLLPLLDEHFAARIENARVHHQMILARLRLRSAFHRSSRALPVRVVNIKQFHFSLLQIAPHGFLHAGRKSLPFSVT